MKFASLCVLSFQRKEFLQRSLDSLKRNTTFPYELIINDDGSDYDVKVFLHDQYFAGSFSWLISNGGLNMGVGKSLHNCIGVSSGDIIYKLDADLEYLPNWLEITSNILENNPDVGAVGLFNYRNYDSNDKRFEIIEERKDCYIVTDFVNSGYCFRRRTYEEHGHALGDDGWQQYLKQKIYHAEVISEDIDADLYKLAIPKQDVVINFGFGKNSIYVKDGKVHEKSQYPKIFNLK